jgi:hypothetical protein
VFLALGHLHTYRRRPHDTQWREAARVAAVALGPGLKIAVAPPYAVNAMRYYLRDTQAAESAVPAAAADTANPHIRILVIGDQWNARGKAAKLLAQFPRALAAFRGVRVCGRGAPTAR